MVIRCLSFGSLWWLRPGDQVSDALRFSSRAAIFNTTGFHCGSRERRSWHVAGVVRINAGMHCGKNPMEDFVACLFESAGIEHRGEWNRLLLGRRQRKESPAEKLLLCAQSDQIGRINFGSEWCGKGVEVIAASASRGIQETLLLASPATEIHTEHGQWEVTWNGFRLMN